MGPCAYPLPAGIPERDFVPMVKGRGSMALAGPHLVRAAVGEDVTQEELGGSRVHCRKSGVGDLEVADDEECIARIKQYLSFMPSHNREAPPRRATADPIERMDDELLDVLPSQSQARHVRRHPPHRRRRRMARPQAPVGQTIITCFARFGGRQVSIGQPAAPVEEGSSQRLDGARFVNLCNAFGLPLVFLQDYRASGRHQVRRRGSSATGPRCSRGGRDGAQDHRRAAQAYGAGCTS
jgi:acetyl-CoA carboxylase carboxyltransferase component